MKRFIFIGFVLAGFVPFVAMASRIDTIADTGLYYGRSSTYNADATVRDDKCRLYQANNSAGLVYDYAFTGCTGDVDDLVSSDAHSNALIYQSTAPSAGAITQVRFKGDGLRMYVSGCYNDFGGCLINGGRIFQYDLGAAWYLPSMTASTSVSVGSSIDIVCGFDISSDGSRIVFTGVTENVGSGACSDVNDTGRRSIFYGTLSTPWDITTLTGVSSITSDIGGLTGVQWINQGYSLVLTTRYSTTTFIEYSLDTAYRLDLTVAYLDSRSFSSVDNAMSGFSVSGVGLYIWGDQFDRIYQFYGSFGGVTDSSATTTRILSIYSPTAGQTMSTSSVTFDFTYFFNSVNDFGIVDKSGIDLVDTATGEYTATEEQDILATGEGRYVNEVNLRWGGMYSWRPYLTGAGKTIYGNWQFLYVGSASDIMTVYTPSVLGDDNVASSTDRMAQIVGLIMNRRPFVYISQYQGWIDSWSDISQEATSTTVLLPFGGFGTTTTVLLNFTTVYQSHGILSFVRTFMGWVIYLTMGLFIYKAVLRLL